MLCPIPPALLPLLEEEEEEAINLPVLPTSEDVYCCTEVRLGSQSLMLEGKEEEMVVELPEVAVVELTP